MTTLSKAIVDSAIRVSAEFKEDPEFLLAFDATETAGKPFEPGPGNMPTFLCEPYQFGKQLPKDQVAAAMKAGLATRTWSPKGYSDQGTHDGRMARFTRMKALNETAAYQSISMGLGQVMGFNHSVCGYPAAKTMFEAFSANGLDEMHRAAMHFMISRGILAALKAKDYDRAASLYNGPRYRENQYQTKLARNVAHWHTAIGSGQTQPPTDGVGLGHQGTQVAHVQAHLKRIGTYSGKIDGDFSTQTMSAVSSFQTRNVARFDLARQDGVADDATVAALEQAPPQPQGARATETLADTCKNDTAARGGFWAKRVIEGVGLETLTDGHPLGALSGLLDEMDSLKSTVSRLGDWRSVFVDGWNSPQGADARVAVLGHAHLEAAVVLGLCAIGWAVVHFHVQLPRLFARRTQAVAA